MMIAHSIRQAMAIQRDRCRCIGRGCRWHRWWATVAGTENLFVRLQRGLLDDGYEMSFRGVSDSWCPHGALASSAPEALEYRNSVGRRK